MAQADGVIKKLRSQLENFQAETSKENVGTVLEVGDGIAKIAGLSQIAASEILQFETADGKPLSGLALNLEEDHVGAVIFGAYDKIGEGSVVRATGKVLSVPVGDALSGRVVNALLEPIDGKGTIEKKADYAVEKIAPGVITRESVSKPLQTGIKAI